MIDQEKLISILQDARSAIGKIKIERIRGMGYYHAEVEWLVEREDDIQAMLKVAKEPCTFRSELAELLTKYKMDSIVGMLPENIATHLDQTYYSLKNTVERANDV